MPIKELEEITKSDQTKEPLNDKPEKELSINLVLLLVCSINILVIVLGLTSGKPIQEVFGKEASFITWVSFLQLLIIANYSWKTYKIRKEQLKIDFWKSPALIWMLITLGFVFLSIDEVVRIHENMDSFIHKRMFHIKENAFTDRIDDLIIGVYAIIGTGFLYKFRNELKKYYKSIPLLIIGFILILLMMISELVANRFDLLPYIIHNRKTAKDIYVVFKVLEEAFKLFSESVLIATFYSFFKTSKKLTNDRS